MSHHHTYHAPLQHSIPIHNTVIVLTGEEEDLDLGKMVREGEVAWLHKADMPGSGSGRAEESHQQAWHAQRQGPHSPDQAAARKRKDPPASRHTYPATRPALDNPGCTLTVLPDELHVRCRGIHSCISGTVGLMSGLHFLHLLLWWIRFNIGASPALAASYLSSFLLLALTMIIGSLSAQ